MSDDGADELMLLSVALAKRARQEAASDAAIAASLGPYGAILHNGSEYSGNYGVSSEVLHDLLRDCSTPSWISFSCCDEAHICDGTRVSEAASLFADHPSVVAIGVNCTPPR